MQVIEYSSHWNWKLANKTFFTTIRKNSSKYRLGDTFKHVFKDFEVEAELVKIEVRRWSDFTEFEIKIVDVNGQVLYQNSIQLDQNSFRFTIPIELKSGIYIVNVQNAKNEGIQTLVISQ